MNASEQFNARLSGLSVVFWLAVALAGLSGCQHQPPGADLWIAVGAAR